MLTLKDIIETLQQHKAVLQEKYGIVALAVFGSFVRGEQTPESDIDILIEQGQPSLGWNYFALAYELNTILQHKTDMITRDAIKPRYYDAIKKELVYV
ncbi:nucleotidyltransferase family protein [Nibrella saemangeumensis]|uniref:Nucleotidyltransferase family protein n=1 Tax=Nibrella saemangeumensis TaxID=1084526 RepID=A0ABP8N541_9BACT